MQLRLTMDISKHNLFRGEIGTIVECYPNNGYEVEFVSLDGFTYALVALRGDQLIPLRQKSQRMAESTVSATIFTNQPAMEVAAIAEQ